MDAWREFHLLKGSIVLWTIKNKNASGINVFQRPSIDGDMNVFFCNAPPETRGGLVPFCTALPSSWRSMNGEQRFYDTMILLHVTYYIQFFGHLSLLTE